MTVRFRCHNLTVAAVVLIAGGSGSGKSTLARALADRLGAALITVDRYYRGFEEVPLARRRLLNFDSPEAIDHDLLSCHIGKLKSGKPVQIPCYDFAAFERLRESETLPPAEVLVVEGLFALFWEELRQLSHLGIYMGTEKQVCLKRRMHRDLVDFGRTAEDALLRYHTYVQPCHEQFVQPTAQYADMHLDGTLPVDALVDSVLQRLADLTLLTNA